MSENEPGNDGPQRDVEIRINCGGCLKWIVNKTFLVGALAFMYRYGTETWRGEPASDWLAVAALGLLVLAYATRDKDFY